MDTTDADVEAELTDERPEPVENDAEVVGGLSENVAGALAYLFAPLVAIVLYLTEDENEYVRFHSVQSIVVFGGLFCLYVAIFVFGMLLEAIPVVGLVFALVTGLFSLLMVPVVFVLWALLTYKAYTGDADGLPVVGKVARDHV